MEARREGKRFCVDFGRTVPTYKWDKYGDGTWNPPRHYIMTSDIATPDNDFEQEEKNIYDFLRGKKASRRYGYVTRRWKNFIEFFLFKKDK